jgi:RES domain-containing protein
MELYRLARKRYAADFSGKGAALAGGRWNSAGVPVLYLAANRSLAMAEVLVHFSMATMPLDYQMLTLWLPDDTSITSLLGAALPADWFVFPPSDSTQKVGNQFVADGEFCLMKLPSAVTRGDFNLLVNPNHADAKALRVLHAEPFPFDFRLLPPFFHPPTGS